MCLNSQVAAGLRNAMGLVLCLSLAACTSRLIQGSENPATEAATTSQPVPPALPATSPSLQPMGSRSPATQVLGAALPLTATIRGLNLPSGDYLVYCLEEAGLGDADGASSFQISTVDGEVVGRVPVDYCDNVSLSPTARYLAVGDQSGGASGIRAVELATGKARQLDASTDCERPVWSPDERWLVAECANGVFTFLRVVGPQESRRFDWFEQNIGACRSPAWSPNGEWIAFTCDFAPLPSGMGYALSVSCLGSSTQCPETPIWLGPIFSPLAWSPDSDSIIATWVPDWWDPTKGPPVFAVFDASGDSGQPLRVPEQSDTPWVASAAAWSPNGRTLAYTRRTSPGGGWVEVRLVPVEGGESVTIADGLLGEGHYLTWLTVP